MTDCVTYSYVTNDVEVFVVAGCFMIFSDSYDYILSAQYV